MGFGRHQVKFLGHGIGLWIDEKPVIAKGFDEPLEEGMVFALEPKKGIQGCGAGRDRKYFYRDSSGGSMHHWRQSRVDPGILIMRSIVRSVDGILSLANSFLASEDL